MQFSEDIISLLKNKSLANVATADKKDQPNVSLKGIVDFNEQEGTLYFLDLFCNNTRKNLQENEKVAITVVDYDNFLGYQFKGTVEIIDSGAEFEKYSFEWNLKKHNRFRDRINWNMSRFVKDTQSELDLPKPKYLVKVTVNETINLAAFKAEPCT
jgi:predicted pyridoxine 5'-phosphate oxidase superfamily flavin-nucleotide-binding protein